jgi:tRNA A37 threonylcarbamoyladenosine synthetase subunit TsaC/SUA5/YrdC
MSIAKEPFRLYNENQEEKPDIFTIRLNKEERLWLNKAKTYIQQPKDSSALKLLAELGVPVETPSFNTNVTGLEYQNQESK